MLGFMYLSSAIRYSRRHGGRVYVTKNPRYPHFCYEVRR